MVTTHTDFRSYLQAELVRRCKRNSGYSIRAFAKALEMDASTLTKILNGKRAIGRRSIEKIGKQLGLSTTELEYFTKSGGIGPDNDTYDQLKLDLFEVLSDWHYMAILELMTIEDFQTNPKWIAKALGLSLTETKNSIARLVNVGMLEIDSLGNWIDKSSGRTSNISPNMTSTAAKTLQKQFLEKAIMAIDEVPLQQRDQTAMTMAIDINKIPLAREQIKLFRRSLAKLLCRSGKRNDVYNLTISLYPLTHLKRETDE